MTFFEVVCGAIFACKVTAAAIFGRSVVIDFWPFRPRRVLKAIALHEKAA